MGSVNIAGEMWVIIAYKQVILLAGERMALAMMNLIAVHSAFRAINILGNILIIIRSSLKSDLEQRD